MDCQCVTLPLSSHSGVDCAQIWEAKELCPGPQSVRLIAGDSCVVDPEGIADADNDRRMMQHGCEDRELEHLFITDHHCGALLIDHENTGRVETKGNAHFAERHPHS